jgi:ABC-2 type transport system permease protein
MGPRPASLPGPGPVLLAQVRYQLLLGRNPNVLVAGVLLPVMLLVLSSTHTSRVAVASLAGRVVLGVTLIAYTTHASGLVAAREAGVLKRWRATPLPRWCYFAGRTCATVLTALASAAVTVLIGVLAYHAHVSAGAAVSLLAALVLGALAWASVGTAVTAAIPTTTAAQPLLALSYFVATWPSWRPGRPPRCSPPCTCSAGSPRPRGSRAPGRCTGGPVRRRRRQQADDGGQPG